MSNSGIPREVQVRLTREANLYAYGKLGLHPDSSNPSSSQQQQIVSIGTKKYDELVREWWANNKK